MRRILIGGLALLLLIVAEPHAGRAQDWPSRPIKLVVPFSPGGSADTLGRIFAHTLSESLGRPVYVENRGGAGGMTASAQVARAEPDGYTLVVSGVASHVIAPLFSARSDYDPMRDFTHIAYFGGPPIVVVAHPSLGVRTLEQLVALLRKGPEPQSYGSPGAGSQGHLVAANLAQKLGLKLAHVPYKGGSPAMFDLIGGHIKLASVTWTTALAHIEFWGRRPHRRDRKQAPDKSSISADLCGAGISRSGCDHVVFTIWPSASAGRHRRPPEPRGLEGSRSAGGPREARSGGHRSRKDGCRRIHRVRRG